MFRLITTKVFRNGVKTILFKRNISKSNNQNSPVRSGVTSVFEKYLLATNTISSGVLMFLGDICQQEIEFQQGKLQSRYDTGRLTRMFLVGLVALGPIHHYYYLWLARKWPSRTTKIVTWKIMLDQFVVSPICISGFFYGMGSLENKSIHEMNNEIKAKFKEVYMMDWMVWPPTQFINFYYLPVKYQVIYINTIQMLYNIFLSYIKHREYDNEYTATKNKLILLENPSKKS